jgi:hypothetical protein
MLGDMPIANLSFTKYPMFPFNNKLEVLELVEVEPSLLVKLDIL